MTETATHGRSLVVQIVSAEKHVTTVPMITNVVLASAVMAATVRQCALSGPEELLLVL